MTFCSPPIGSDRADPTLRETRGASEERRAERELHISKQIQQEVPVISLTIAASSQLKRTSSEWTAANINSEFSTVMSKGGMVEYTLVLSSSMMHS